MHYFFWFKSTTKTIPVPEIFLGEFYNRGCNKAEKRSLCEKKHFSILGLGKNEIKSGNKYYLLLLHILFKSSPNKLSGTGFVFVLA